MKPFAMLLILVSSMTLFKARAYDYGPVASGAAEARTTRDQRLLHVAQQIARDPLPPAPTPPKVGFAEYINGSVSRMVLRQDLEAVNAGILTESFLPWNVGTEISIAGPLCKRMGDYDFVLMGLLRMVYLDEEAGQTLLSAAARKKLRTVLLNQRGNRHQTHFRLKNCLPIKIKDSENHILMIEIARYLTNQLEGVDNEKNGFNKWFLEHLAEFLRTDFDELNSRPYQGYTLIALSVLYDYAHDARVKTTAKMILDYLSAKTAVQSVGLRRYPPFRRQKNHRDADDLLQADNTMSWYTFHTAKHDYVTMGAQNGPSSYMYLMAGTSKYEMPSSVLELFFDRSVPVFQKIKSRDVEIYFSSPSFLLTGGGRHRHVFGYFTKENNVWAMPITIIPANSGTRLQDLFQLAGPDEWTKRNNLCVAPNFACGSNFKEPVGLPESCKRHEGDWTFYDLANCKQTSGFYLAVKRIGLQAFWEVREPTIDFNDFVERVKNKNPQTYLPTGPQSYVTSEGHRIEFTWEQKSRKHYPILSYDGVPSIREYEKWEYAVGDVIQSKGDGVIQLTNPVTREVDLLDAKDPLNPRRLSSGN